MDSGAINRRDFVKYAAATAAGAAMLRATPAWAQSEAKVMPKAFVIGMAPEKLSMEEKFKLAKECGFDGVEVYPVEDLALAASYAEAAKAAGIRIHSVMYGGWKAPFSDPDDAVIAKGLKEMEIALRSAKVMGADTVLLVPAVVNEHVGYREAYERSQRHIRKLVPIAEETGVIIAIEDVWNKFLVSPIEFARYIDEFESPWVQAYFDVGNIIEYGYAQDWIRILDKRIVKVHVKDYKRDGKQWKPLLEGDVNWPEVRKAFAEIGYTGFVTAEVEGGGAEQLTEIARRIDTFIAMT